MIRVANINRKNIAMLKELQQDKDFLKKHYTTVRNGIAC